MMKKLRCAIMPLIFIFAGCVSMVEKTGQVLDGSAFAEKKIARYRALEKEGAACDMEIIETQNRQGQRALVVSLEQFPAVKIRGSAPDARGNFWLNSLEYLSGSTAGWNEYSLELSGTGNFRQNENGAVFSLGPEIDRVQIARGKIHRYDTRITGSEALTNLRNRELRIEVLAEWMKARESAPAKMSRDDFAAYWKPILFPEMCAKRRRPAGWQNEGDAWVRAEDIRWNTSYTARTFSGELAPVRDSGTLLRDWEEAFEWVYLQYEWETLAVLLSRETTLKRVK